MPKKLGASSSTPLGTLFFSRPPRCRPRSLRNLLQRSTPPRAAVGWCPAVLCALRYLGPLVFFVPVLWFPQFDFVSFWVHSPSKTPVLVVFGPLLDRNAALL